MTCQPGDAGRVVLRLRTMSNAANVRGMMRFGISPHNTLGVSVPDLRMIAKETGTNHGLALELWRTGIHEARNLAGLIDDPSAVTETQMERWAGDFDSWDICDGVCSNLFDKTPFAAAKARAWSRRKEEYVKRAGFVLMAALAVHDKEAADKLFESFLPIIKRESIDDRNFVRKAVNWALRQIGKRNVNLNRVAIRTAKEIQRIDSRAAKWVATDALRELEGPAVARKLGRKMAQKSLSR